MADKALQNGDKYIFGTVRVGEKGQIVIPKQSREIFDIKHGDTLLLLGDREQGIGIVKQKKRSNLRAPSLRRDFALFAHRVRG